MRYNVECVMTIPPHNWEHVKRCFTLWGARRYVGSAVTEDRCVREWRIRDDEGRVHSHVERKPIRQERTRIVRQSELGKATRGYSRLSPTARKITNADLPLKSAIKDAHTVSSPHPRIR